MTRALIAEDEPILAATLAKTLQGLWPELDIVGKAPNGLAAVEQALALRPDVLFLDIRMPGQTGLEAAEELAERWEGPQPFPHIVFVTAFDDYAVEAFERAAVDYVLKPVSAGRLGKTVERLRALVEARRAPAVGVADADSLGQLLGQLQALLPAAAATERLTTVRAAVGNVVRMIPVADVVFFQAVDKYVNVATVDGEALIRVPLKDLLPQLDPDRFRQVSRSMVVNMACVISAGRDDFGKVTLNLRGRADKPRVSPVYAHLFRQM
ncbi:LytTR family DNA-binding domain-containing protein [Massilia sp. CFBP9012]|uniref:LytR/AlgR family response regulator transcription factor n=1 Tax=Massilia sp. CFBP9012 TaxID=3096531 RepID=UPI002A6B265E|nr:LytTR family DNA-binding domain-containing protein [Massilia sp. CFBP9012]MDY0973329.1 LytTR family DNA-binding domain-containing protein [Massilia sp. CFBP9012]